MSFIFPTLYNRILLILDNEQMSIFSIQIMTLYCLGNCFNSLELIRNYKFFGNQCVINSSERATNFEDDFIKTN